MSSFLSGRGPSRPPPSRSIKSAAGPSGARAEPRRGRLSAFGSIVQGQCEVGASVRGRPYEVVSLPRGMDRDVAEPLRLAQVPDVVAYAWRNGAERAHAHRDPSNALRPGAGDLAG